MSVLSAVALLTCLLVLVLMRAWGLSQLLRAAGLLHTAPVSVYGILLATSASEELPRTGLLCSVQ